MKRMALLVLFIVVIPASASAGILGNARAWLSSEALVFFISALLTVLAGIAGAAFIRIARTFRETGEFLIYLGKAVEDGRITREELGGIIKEGKDIFVLWR